MTRDQSRSRSNLLKLDQKDQKCVVNLFQVNGIAVAEVNCITKALETKMLVFFSMLMINDKTSE